VRGNLIGTQKDALKPLGNGSEGGVVVAEDDPGKASGNSILSNSIFANGGLGIDLANTTFADGPTPNDGDDPNTPQVDPDGDAGSNNLQNKPSLGSAKTISGTTTVRGTLTSYPDGFYSVQFFSNPKGTDEGRTFIGQKTGLKADGTGKLSFSFQPNTAVAVGQTITATATDEFTGDTSEFSAPRTVASS
jgi:hypothetical protein